MRVPAPGLGRVVGVVLVEDAGDLLVGHVAHAFTFYGHDERFAWICV